MCAINCEDCEDKDTCELRPSVTEYNKANTGANRPEI